ncbi:hypothetical protein OG894_43515 (plasmid) [Streptomyces sp. NBC_01724]|uniref:hypothetical protein n=1 Tax=Streptomyces sp. NBC_01724 TaxID=2975922 RepID=UPI002E3311E7|nr:hypothetical protein [Streptomyces sp. NBC_01724]
MVAVGQGLALAGRIPGPESTPSAALNLDLLRCTALEFDVELNPALCCGWEAAVREHAAAENYDTAGAALEVFELHGGRAETIGKLREEHHRRRRTSRQEVENLHRDVTHRAETAARLGQLSEPGRSRVIARLEAVKQALRWDNLGTIRRECVEILGLLDTRTRPAANSRLPPCPASTAPMPRPPWQTEFVL